MACEDMVQTETAMFESAELHYRLGNYDEAITGYQAFLRQYPTSPLTKTVDMRMRTIHREVASILDRPGMPRPVYHGSGLKESQGGGKAASTGDETDEPKELDEPEKLEILDIKIEQPH